MTDKEKLESLIEEIKIYVSCLRQNKANPHISESHRKALVCADDLEELINEFFVMVKINEDKEG